MDMQIDIHVTSIERRNSKIKDASVNQTELVTDALRQSMQGLS